MYYLQDLNGEQIKGKFYKEEILDIGPEKPSVYRIERILKTEGTGKHKRHYVKWMDKLHKPSWVNASDLQ